MSKKRLSNQQIRRIQKKQDAKKKRMHEESISGETASSLSLGPEQEGLVISHFGRQVIVENANRHRFLCLLRQNIGDLVAGDRVIWRQAQDAKGVVEARQNRQSVLGRPNKQGLVKPMAANISLILITFAPQPEPSLSLIDSYLVVCETLNIDAKLVFNKTDLLPKNEALWHEIKKTYPPLGYEILEVSSLSQHGLMELEHCLNQHTSVFVGQSGVGKSSLIKTIVSDDSIRIGDVSASSDLGKHTTSNSQLYHIQTGGMLIDSPGIREFGLWHMDKQQVEDGFVEFRALVKACKYRNCTHKKEPHCAIQEAFIAGMLSPSRLRSYHKIIDNMTHTH